MRFTDTFIKRPVFATSISLLILVLGLNAIATLQIRQYPRLTNTVITVTTTYPGASAELMQGFVTQPIQQAVATAEGIDYMTSLSSIGTSTITVNVRLNYDPNAAMTEVQAQVASVRSQLPRGINDPVISKSTGEQVSILYLAFSSDTLNAQQITDYLSRVMQPRLATVPGVAQPQILGEQSFAMRVWLDPQRMAAFGLTAEQVQQALAANNYQATPGQIRGYFNVFNVDARTDLTSPEQFGRMIVASREDGIVRLGDVGRAMLGAQNSDVQVIVGDRPAVFIGVNPTPDANPLDVVRQIRAMMPDLGRDLPPGLNMQIVYDTTVFIRQSIDEVIKTIAEAALIVIVVIFLFLGTLRAVAIPIVTIPLSLIGVCIVLLALGFTINLLTLLAMVLAIGLVVDDAIVVVENVDRHLKEGKTPFQAAIVGTREIAVPVISMTITLAAVYAPIALLGGLTGTLFQEFALTLAGAVIVSGIIALTLSPMMCSRILRHKTKPGRLEGLIERTLAAVQRGYARLLHNSLNYRPVTAVFALIVFASLYFLFTAIPTELAPSEDQGVVLVSSRGPADANIDYMTTYAAEINKVFAGIPETQVGFTISGTPSLNQGLGIMVLKPWSDRDRTQAQVLPEVQGKVGQVVGVYSSAFPPSSLPGASGLPVQFVVNTISDYRTLEQAMERLQDAARRSGLFAFTDVDLKFDTPTLVVRINRDKAGAYGVTMEAIGQVLSTMMSGGYVNRMSIEGRSYEVIPQVPRIFRLTPQAFESYYVRSASGAPIPLSNLIEVTTDIRPSGLTQFNQLNSATLSAALLPGVSLGTAIAFLQQAAAEVLPVGFAYDYMGESRQYVQEGSALIFTFMLALIIIFLVLASQFESFRDPLVILVSVPLSICGALIPLSLGAATMNIYSQVGLITLIGLISKHGILICEVAKEEQIREGLDRRAAVERAAGIRLRPILMTTGAMVAGLIPLLFASGAGAASRFAIGLVIVAGLSVGTLFTLFVLPAIYTYIASDHRVRHGEEELVDAVAAPAATGTTPSQASATLADETTR